MPYRLLAVDLDGTLMDPNGKLTDAARQAVAAAQDAGLQVVLCTGRRFRTTLPVLRALELEGCAVVNNGAVVKEIASGKTLHRDYLPAEIYPDVVALAIRAEPRGLRVATLGPAVPFPVDLDLRNARGVHRP